MSQGHFDRQGGYHLVTIQDLWRVSLSVRLRMIIRLMIG